MVAFDDRQGGLVQAVEAGELDGAEVVGGFLLGCLECALDGPVGMARVDEAELLGDLGEAEGSYAEPAGFGVAFGGLGVRGPLAVAVSDLAAACHAALPNICMHTITDIMWRLKSGISSRVTRGFWLDDA